MDMAPKLTCRGLGPSNAFLRGCSETMVWFLTLLESRYLVETENSKQFSRQCLVDSSSLS